MHQHGDWASNNPSAKIAAVKATIEDDSSLWDRSALHITWVENGSIWISLASGSKKAFSWLAQLFEKNTDARLRQAIAAAAAAEEDAAIKRLTRDQIAYAKNLEQERLAAKYIKETRREWQQSVLADIDFKQKLAEKIKDEQIRAVAQQQIDSAIADLIQSNFMPIVEHVPVIMPSDKDVLKVVRTDRNNRY